MILAKLKKKFASKKNFSEEKKKAAAKAVVKAVAKSVSSKKASKPSTKELASKKALIDKKTLVKKAPPAPKVHVDSSRVLTAEGWDRRR